MTDHNVFHAEFFQHFRADLARESALIRPCHVLRAELYLAALYGLAYRREVGEGNADDHFGLCFRHEGLEFFYQLDRFRRGLVHFPVAGNDGFSHDVIYLLSFCR